MKSVYTVAVDIGGTFTDVVIIDQDSGTIVPGKSLSTPDNLIEGVLHSLEDGARKLNVDIDQLLEQTGRFVHATTQSTNALLTYSGASTALITTRGFGDTMDIMRGNGRVAGLSVHGRHHFRATDKPPALVSREYVFEVTERVDYRGRPVTPLDQKQLQRVVRRIGEGDFEAVAVCLLFGYQNPRHEQHVGEVLRREYPGLYVSLSSEIAPLMGEYERMATTVVDAYVGPVIEDYLKRLVSVLRERGLDAELQVVQANGGVTPVDQTVPIYTVESGPAVGVVGAAHLGEQLGRDDVIATDVGGTTFKVSVIEDGNWDYTRRTVLNQYRLNFPMIDIASIGAGGGSIAWNDGGRLRVGPRSAGADPGPACYGRGGSRPTVTDADVLLGYIAPETFLGGEMKLDVDAARRAVRRHVADPLFEGDVLEAAAGIRAVINHQMADQIRKSTLQRGYDPRDFSLMAYGGAGPTHCATYGRQLGMEEVIIPYWATVHSAYGAAISDLRYSLETSEPTVLDGSVAEDVEAVFQQLEEQAGELRRRVDSDVREWNIHRWVEARYRRQVHVVRVPFAADATADGAVNAAADRFESEYEHQFGAGTAYKEAGIEFVNFGLEVVGRVENPGLPAPDASAEESFRGERPMYDPNTGKRVEAPVFDGASLDPGRTIEGLAVIEHPGTNILVLPGQVAEIDPSRNTVLRFDSVQAKGGVSRADVRLARD